MGETLKRQEREGGKGRTWKKNFRALNNQLLALEEDETGLELVFPQVGAGLSLAALLASCIDLKP